GLTSVGQAQAYSEEFWVRRFGKWGKALYERCHGRDEREVEPFAAPKSASAETTFEKDTGDREELKTWLLRHAERVGASLRRAGYRGRTVTLKVKYADFTLVTRSHSLPGPTDSTRVIYELGAGLLEELNPRMKLRLIGLGVANLVHESEGSAPPAGERAEEELSLPGLELPGKKKAADALLPPDLDTRKERALDQALDRMRDKFGRRVIVRGRLFEDRAEEDREEEE
ncbi:MAG: DNA polymerase IV, partial [Deltaproteobacteria bacterium]|nr:DNA polymerase IV [Deltaproteobacteria bacterium]